MPTPFSPHGTTRSVHRGATVAAFAAALALFVYPRPEARQAVAPEDTPRYPLLMTVERVNALLEAETRGLDYVPGDVLVKFKPGMTPVDQDRALASLRSRPRASALRWAGPFAVLHDDFEPDGRLLAATLKRQPEVLSAEPNYLYRARSEPNDPGYAARQWNMKTLDMPRAWDINPGGSPSVIVAVVDSGVTSTSGNFVFSTWSGTSIQNFTARVAGNPDLAAARLVSPKDFVFWEGPVLDMDGHGTHVSGTIGQDSNNGAGEAGMAYRVSIMPVKVCYGYWDLQLTQAALGQPGFVPLSAGACPNDLVVQGIRYAVDNGAKVINVSLGGPTPSEAMAEAIRYAVSKGVFVAIAGGNAFTHGNPPDYPANYAADIDGAMSVAAVGPSLTHAYYSTANSRIEIAAPGGSDKEGGTAGLVWQYSLLDSDSNAASVIFPRFDRYTDVPLQGTSMATPHVAGLAALLLSQGVSKPAAIEALIKATARDLGAKGRDDETGYGLIQPRTALRGFGVTR